MTSPITNKVVLISGASRGIGAAIARRLHGDGWQLSLGMRSAQLPEGIDSDAVQVQTYDAFNANEQDWINASLAHFGRIDAVICSAGLMTPGSIVDIDDNELERMLEVNVKAPRRLVQAAWQALGESGHGRVILLGSLSGKRVKSVGSSAYALTKYATVALGHGIRQTGWELGIRATVVCPGLVNTDMVRGATDMDERDMIQPDAVARMVALALSLPNQASMAEMHVNCVLEECY